MFPRIVVIASGPRRAGPTNGLILRQSIRQPSTKLHKELCLFSFSNMRRPQRRDAEPIPRALLSPTLARGDRFTGLAGSKGVQGEKDSRPRLCTTATV